jgi:hypothetical protein
VRCLLLKNRPKRTYTYTELIIFRISDTYFACECMLWYVRYDRTELWCRSSSKLTEMIGMYHSDTQNRFASIITYIHAAHQTSIVNVGFQASLIFWLHIYIFFSYITPNLRKIILAEKFLRTYLHKANLCYYALCMLVSINAQEQEVVPYTTIVRHINCISNRSQQTNLYKTKLKRLWDQTLTSDSLWLFKDVVSTEQLHWQDAQG